MLKNKRNPTIVSRLFDTINNMTIEEGSENSESAMIPEEKEPILPSYQVSAPNKAMPLKFTRTKPLMLCTYQVRTDGIYPFILFLLQKNGSQLSLPLINGESNGKKIIIAARTWLKKLFPRQSASYAGFYETKANNIIVFNCDQPTTINLETLDYVWATAFEILNKKILSYSLEQSVSDFFRANLDFLRLTDENDGIIESPMIGYAPAPLTCVFEELDIFRETRLAGLGKCYYLFTEIPLDKKMMRIAFFAGIMLFYPLPKDAKYDSIISPTREHICIKNYDQHVILSR